MIKKNSGIKPIAGTTNNQQKMGNSTDDQQKIKPPHLTIIARDQSLVVINKPAGLLVHKSAIDFHEQQNAQEILQQQINSEVFPAHRLDKPTSGALLFALNRETASKLARKFQNHEVYKDYIAIVRGHTDDKGSIDNPVRDKDAPKKPKKTATTHYETLARITLPFAVDQYPEARYSLLKMRPESGRRHQLRQHMKHISHPIIGDTSYGKTTHNRFFKQQLHCARLLLHAKSLKFTHPNNGEPVTLSAAYDEPFERVIGLQQWQWLNRDGLTEL